MKPLLKQILSQKTKNDLWWMIINCDFDYSRIQIADHEVDDETITIWLEDKMDFKNTLDDCLEVKIPVKFFGGFIESENLNKYEALNMHPRKKFIYKSYKTIAPAMQWYNNDATATEQLWAREALLKAVLEHMAENETLIKAEE